MSSSKDLLIVGVSPRVVALDRETGTLAWATELPNAFQLVTIRVEDDRVYAGSAGEVCALDATSGAILWHNPLKGFGTNEVMFSSTAWHQPARE